MLVCTIDGGCYPFAWHLTTEGEVRDYVERHVRTYLGTNGRLSAPRIMDHRPFVGITDCVCTEECGGRGDGSYFDTAEHLTAPVRMMNLDFMDA